MTSIDSAPPELRVAITEFWPPEEWDNAAAIAQLESGWDAFALHNTADRWGCGTIVGTIGGVAITGERSVGYFQINSCAHPDWEWQRLYNARENAGTAHALWAVRGWEPWFFSAKRLGLL